MMTLGGELTDYLHDGLHLTRTGYGVLFLDLMRAIEMYYPDQLPEDLEFALPRWDDEYAWRE